ncbi:MAG: hypothetical protein AAF789_01110, partial [Bacteroidota bacterium]
MQKKLNEDFIDSYCEKFASKISTEFFKEGKEVITGKEILSVSPSKQVNFFVIKLLFRYWQEETKKLESPFFNYKHVEVREAMVQFMNVLSQHIEINSEKFETLLNHAVKDTLYLAAMPQAYVEIDLDSRGVDEIRDKTIEGTIKYLKIYKKEINNFLSDMRGLTIDDVIDELPEEFDDFDTSDAVNEQCELLSQVLDISSEKIYSDDPEMEEDFDKIDEDELLSPGVEDLVEQTPPAKKQEAPKPEPILEPAAESEPIIEVDTEDESMKEEVLSEEAAAVDPAEMVEKVSVVEEEKPKITPPVILDQDDKEDDFPEETINDKFEKKEEESLAEHHESVLKGNSILDLISLNHRYMFIQELFRNDKEEFEKALGELEAFESFDDSVEFLVQSYAK